MITCFPDVQPVFTAEEVAEARSLRSSEIGVQSDGSAISGRALPEEQYTFNLYGLTVRTGAMLGDDAADCTCCWA